MEDLLKVVSSVKIDEERQPTGVDTAPLRDGRAIEQPPTRVATPENALEILKSQPGKSEVLSVLNFLDPVAAADTGFNVTLPGPAAAQILHTLVSTTIPDHWNTLWVDDELGPSSKTGRRHKQQAILLRCLSSVSGIGVLVAQLRKLISVQAAPEHQGSGSGTRLVLRDLLLVLSSILKPPGSLLHIYSDTSRYARKPVQKQLMWKELISLLAAGKVLSTAAETIKSAGDLTNPKSLWVGEGRSYASWLGGAIAFMAKRLQAEDTEGWTCLSSLTGRALSLGYTDRLVGTICSDLLLAGDYNPDKFGFLLDALRQHEKSKVFEVLVRKLESKYLSRNQDHPENLGDSAGSRAVSGVAGIVASVIRKRPLIEEQLKQWLIGGIGGSIASFSMRRALLAAVESETGSVEEILRRGIELFGEKLSILHSPIGAQEANAQIILLAAGHVYRSNPTGMANITRSSSYLSAVSNRLSASSTRARFLGMIVAMAFSRLIDSKDNALRFDLEEMETEEAKWYLELPKIQDHIGPVESLRDLDELDDQTTRQGSRQKSTTKARGNDKSKPNTGTAKVVSIQEVFDKSDAEDEDLPIYEKPDTDASDSEEDPTLIQRSKPSAPVYIRDLLSYLRDTENVERYHLGISTTSDLIRRKASFGTEVVENARDLALVLVGLQDKYNFPKFQEVRIQGLVALLVTCPITIGKWAAHNLFNADLSQTQRSSIIVAIGLTARELAGYRDEDAKTLDISSPTSDTTFPSKRLPENLEQVYGSTSNSINKISKNISQQTLQPLALNAADAAAGPNALKVRTFSSRMDVEKEREQRESKRKQKTVAKDLHKTLYDGLFSPLVNEFGLMMYSMSSFKGHNPFLQPHLLSLFIQTVTIIFSTLGPNTPNLASLTLDSLTLLITLHNSPVAVESVVLASLLRLFLSALDINISSGTTAEERLVTEFSTQVMEMQEWVGGVFERASKQDEEIRMLAAGIMVKFGDITERYQGRLLGVNSGFTY